MRALAFAALVLAACSPPEPRLPEKSSPRAAVTYPGVARASDARVEVTLAGSTRVLYSPATMRAPRPVLRIAITNPTAEPLDVSGLRVRLDVTRGSQRVRCDDAGANGEDRRREPRVVAPQTSAVFVRTIDCPLVLSGTYVVQVVVAFGEAEPFASGIVTKELAIVVAAPPAAQPREVAVVPGLHAAIGAGGLVPPSTGPGRIVVAFMNARPEPIELPPMAIALRVRRLGTDIPCEDEPAQLDLPHRLEGSSVLTRPVRVSCLGLGVTGAYDVEARLLVGEEVVPIGVLRVDVSADPSHRNRRLLP